jgi:hypothetical protein
MFWCTIGRAEETVASDSKRGIRAATSHLLTRVQIKARKEKWGCDEHGMEKLVQRQDRIRKEGGMLDFSYLEMRIDGVFLQTARIGM